MASLDSRPAVASIDVEDVEQMAAALADCLHLECVPLERKPIEGHWTIVRAGPIVVRLAREHVAMIQHVRVSGRWAFLLPLAALTLARWNGQVIRDGNMIVFPPGVEASVFDPGRLECAVIIVDASVAPALVDMACAGPESSRISYAIRPVQADVRRLQRQHSELRQLASNQGRPDSLRGAAVRVSELLGACVKGAVPVEPRARSSRSAHLIVRRAEALFRQRPGEPVSMAQLSTAAGVSERTLRNAFYQTYTTSPKRYLKIRQLHQVRSALRATGPGGATVTDVATLHGFFELGRFAGEYKKLFGESPSATLRQATATAGSVRTAVAAPVGEQRRPELSLTA